LKSDKEFKLSDEDKDKIKAISAYGLIKHKQSLFVFEPVTFKEKLTSAIQNLFEMIMVLLVILLALKFPSFASGAFILIS
jgi:hypothetical protein